MSRTLPPSAANFINAVIGRSAACLAEGEVGPVGLDALIAAGQDDRLSGELWKTLSVIAATRGGSPNRAEYHAACGKLGLYGFPIPRTRLLATRVASDCSFFPNVGVWALYWTLVVAQQRFAALWAGLGSHEERRTGHLVSEIVAARDWLLDELRAAIGGAAARAGSNRRLRAILVGCLRNLSLDIAYADLSTRWREARTGADFGLVLVRRDRAGTLAYLPMRFQAKRSRAGGRADVSRGDPPGDSQLRALERSGVGHYIYYAAPGRDHGAIVPLVQAASTVRAMRSLTTVDTFVDSLDLATFLLSAVATDAGHLEVDSMELAVAILTGPDGDAPSFLLALSAAPLARGTLASGLRRAIVGVDLHFEDDSEDPESGDQDLNDGDR